MEIARPFAMSLPAVSQHLKVLERAGLIARGGDRQKRSCRLNAERLLETARWFDRRTDKRCRPNRAKQPRCRLLRKVRSVRCVYEARANCKSGAQRGNTRPLVCCPELGRGEHPSLVGDQDALDAQVHEDDANDESGERAAAEEQQDIG